MAIFYTVLISFKRALYEYIGNIHIKKVNDMNFFFT